MSDDEKQCKTCGKRYSYVETAQLCCIKKGCGKVISPNSILSDVCGETIDDGKWFFCKKCRSKKEVKSADSSHN